MTKQFDDFMEKRGRVNRKPPINIRRKFNAIDDSMMFLDLCHMQLTDDELRQCEARYHLTFKTGDGNNPQEDERWKRY